MAEPWQWNTSTTAANVRDRKVSARELAESHLARLDQVNPGLNAVTNDVREEALATANALDESLAAGAEPGPLHGVPITIKENVDVEGQVTPNGMPAFADVVAPSDAPFVEHFKTAGAVIIGRTNAPEMSYRWHTDNPLRGETKNPWSPNRTPGGSSGGAASSVASGIGTIAHGNDLGGSVRQPANCCGLVGLRPSLGRIPSHNASAAADRSLGLQLMSVQGPLTREVADTRLALEVMRQASPRDPWHVAAPVERGPKNEWVKVAVTYGSSNSPTEGAVRAAIDAGAAHLADAGYDVDFVEPPDLDQILAEWRSILATETKTTALDQLLAIGSDDFKNILTWMFEGPAILDLAGYIEALTRRATILRRWGMFLNEHPLVLAPVSQLVPFTPNDDASSRESFLQIMAGHTPLVAVNYLGLPSVAVPTLLTDDGPLGVQLIGRSFREDQCLDAAAAIEARVGVMAENLWNR